MFGIGLIGNGWSKVSTLVIAHDQLTKLNRDFVVGLADFVVGLANFVVRLANFVVGLENFGNDFM